MGPVLPDLLRAVAVRLGSARMPSCIQVSNTSPNLDSASDLHLALKVACFLFSEDL